MTTEEYNTPKEWRKANHKQFKKYRGEWVAFTKNGVIAHHPKYKEMINSIQDRSIDYVIERIYETEFMEPIKFYPIRIKSVKKHEWQPKIVKKTLSSNSHFGTKFSVDVNPV